MPLDFLTIVVQFVIMIVSVMIHEVSHGYVAHLLGDNTAKDSGRLTLNPFKHIDLYGSILLPLFLYFISGGAFVFGWAKPVPFNPLNLKNPKRESGLIALAGPLSNLALAIFGALLLRVNFYSGSFISPLFIVILIRWNVSLMVFNLVPFPPLDGSKILFSLLPRKFEHWGIALERYGIFIFILFLVFGIGFITPVIDFFFRLLVGG